MKKLFTLIIGVILLASCNEDSLTPQSIVLTDNICTVNTKIGEEEAISIANKVLGRHSVSRQAVSGSLSFNYVLSSQTKNSRSNHQDTLAYIINYPNDNGFVIVSTTKNIYPVLAFSDQGNFSFDNEASKIHFIDNIELYISSTSSDLIYEVEDSDFVSCATVAPMVQTTLHQGAPWNKYVVQEHPDCPAGCLAIATALVMLHSQYEMTYHESYYANKSIVEAINKGISTTPNSSINRKRISGGAVVPPYLRKYSYEEAVDSLAKIIYWIGKDVNMQYSPNGSGASFSRGHALCKKMGFSVSSQLSYNINIITNYLINNYIIMMYGQKQNPTEGHAWVIDGCTYCIVSDGLYKDVFVHCDWGWGGNSNGYYSGEVFATVEGEFDLQKYFAIKREWK